MNENEGKVIIGIETDVDENKVKKDTQKVVEITMKSLKDGHINIPLEIKPDRKSKYKRIR